METSILNTIKPMVGVSIDDHAFDLDMIVLINGAIATLKDLGVGKEAFFGITDQNDNWDDFIDDMKKFQMAKNFIYYKVKLVFDPPSSSIVKEAITKQLQETQWRLYSRAEFGGNNG